jgi:integrase
MERAGLIEKIPGKPAKDRNMRTLKVVAFGPHALRHVYASLQIESGVTPKKLQQLMGHATLAMTMDLYGHLWTDPVGDQALADAGERVMTSRT